jgi:tetratricopeptide (TPR) repeat protein
MYAFLIIDVLDCRGVFNVAGQKLLWRRLSFIAVLVALALSLAFTPLGPWVGRGLVGLWQGFLALPGITWAREQWQSASTSEEPESATPSTGSEKINALLREGQALQEKGKSDQALQRYREALKLQEDYVPTHLALASVYLQLGRDEEALKELERAAELAPDNGFVQAQLGRLYLKREEFTKSVLALEKAKELDPEEAQIRYWLGAAYYFRSYADAKAAVAELEKAVELDPKDAEMRTRLAMAYVHRDDPGDRERALQALEKALELDPQQTEAYYYLGQLYLQAGRRREAIAAWREYVAKGEDEEAVAKVRTWLKNLEEGGSPEPAP